jgi:hypothetical protein
MNRIDPVSILIALLVFVALFADYSHRHYHCAQLVVYFLPRATITGLLDLDGGGRWR